LLSNDPTNRITIPVTLLHYNRCSFTLSPSPSSHRKLLSNDPTTRITADQCFEHPWMVPPSPLLSNNITVPLQHHHRHSLTPSSLLSHTITVTLSHHHRYSLTPSPPTSASNTPGWSCNTTVTPS
jgi:serine/threonine protein kinase